MTESYDIDVEACDEGQFSGHSPTEDNISASSMLMAATGGVLTPARPGIKRSGGEREEMIMRKKLRNRESAQRARDRQKAKMRWLEEELQRMKIKNEQLLRENLILRHMCQDKIPQAGGQVNVGNSLGNLPKTATPQNLFQQQAQQVAAAQLRQQQQQQQHLRAAAQQVNNNQLLMQQQLLQQSQQLAKKLHPNGSHDSDNSVPSVLSTGSQNNISPIINQRGDELLKAAAAKTANTNPTMTPDMQAQYAAALAAIAQQGAQTQPPPPVVQQNPAQLAAAMAQATVAAAQQVVQQQQQVVSQPIMQDTSKPKGRPSSVGDSQPSNCHTSDDDKSI